MRIAFVSIPRFPCAVEVQRNPALARRPLIVGDAEVPKRVLDCSLSADAQHVRHGMTIRQALGECPDAEVLPPDPVLYRVRWEAILEALGGLSPEVEDEELGRAYVNVAGLESHYRDDAALAAQVIDAVHVASGLAAQVGLAGGKFPAFAASTCVSLRESLVVPAGGEGAFLAPLSLDLLPVDPEAVRRLRLFGLRTIGEVAVLTLPELQSQFGFEGKRIRQLANGIDEESLRPRARQELLEASLTFEAPVAGIDVMVAAARQLLSRLRVPLRGRAARQITLGAELVSGRGWARQVVMREAVSEDARLAFVLRSALTNFPPPQAVHSLSLRLGGLSGETGKQLRLGERSRLQNQLEEAIRQLKARYGRSPIYRCMEVEPWSVVPEDRQILVESDV